MQRIQMVSGMLVSRQSMMFCSSSCKPGVWNKSSCGRFRHMWHVNSLCFMCTSEACDCDKHDFVSCSLLTWSQDLVKRWLTRIHTSLGIFRGLSSAPVLSTIRKFTFDFSWENKTRYILHWHCLITDYKSQTHDDWLEEHFANGAAYYCRTTAKLEWRTMSN